MLNPLPPSFFDLDFKNSVATMEFKNRYQLTVTKNGLDSYNLKVLNKISNSVEAFLEDLPYEDIDAMMVYLFELNEPLKVIH